MPYSKRKKTKKRSTKVVKVKIEKPILPEVPEPKEEVKDTRRKMTNPDEYSRILNSIGIFLGQEKEFLDYAKESGYFKRNRTIRNQSR